MIRTMRTRLLVPTVVLGFMTFFVLSTQSVSALAAQNSAPNGNGGMQVTVDDGTSYQNHPPRPLQALDDGVLQADQIERSLLSQYSKDTDIILGTYSYGSLQDLKLTRQQAEIIKNGFIPILGNRGEAAIANPDKQYVEYDCGSSCSGDRGIMRCGTTPMAYDGYKTEYEVMVKGSKYGMSTGGYVCAGPNSIRSQCSGIYEHNPCLNGTYQLDNDWLLSIGVNTTEIRRQIEANKYPAPTPTAPPPTPEPQTAPPATDQML